MAPARRPFAAGLGAMLSLECGIPAEQQAESKSGLPKQQLPRFARALSVISLIVFPVFTFLTPFWPYLFNDVLDATSNIYGSGNLCDTKASLLRCGNEGATSYVTQLEDLGLEHRKVDGELFACGCARGWFADWVCSVSSTGFTEERFSLSYFVSTAPGTGAMAAVSFWPIITMWAYGLATREAWISVLEGTNKRVDISSAGLRIATGSILLFQVCYGLFLTAPNCVAPTFHTVVVVLFAIAEFVYFIALATVSFSNAGTATRMSTVIVIFAIVGITALAVGFLLPFRPFGRAGLFFFWLGEVVALNCAFAVSPVLVLMHD